MAQTLTTGDETPQKPQKSSRTTSASKAPQPTPLPLRADSPTSLLAIIPTLLGFMPEASLVLIGTEPSGGTVKVTLRYDLPDPPGVGIAADIAAHGVGVLAAQRLAVAVAVGYGPAPLVDPIAAALRQPGRPKSNCGNCSGSTTGATGPACAETRRAARPQASPST